MEINEELYCCPLTQQIYNNPVVTKFGHTYEKEIIMKHLKTKNIDPLTNQKLTVNDLFPNRNMKDIINSYLEKNPERKTEQYVELGDSDITNLNNTDVTHEINQVAEIVPPTYEVYTTRVIKKGSKKGSGKKGLGKRYNKVGSGKKASGKRYIKKGS